MKTYDLAVMTRKLMESRLAVFKLPDLAALLEIDRESSLFKVINQLVSAGVLVKVERNKYLKAGGVSDFLTANFLYQPSYVSLESALSFWGILPQFSKEVTSVTVKLSKQKQFGGKAFGFYRMQKKLFWGYVKQDGFLIAEKEKAVLDLAYLAAKGVRSWNYDEYELSGIDKIKLKTYAKQTPKNVQKLISSLIR